MWWPALRIPRLFVASSATSSRFWRCPRCGAAGTRLISGRPCSRRCRACYGSIWPTSGWRTGSGAAQWRRLECTEDLISAVAAARLQVSRRREQRSPTRTRPSFSRTLPPGSPCTRPGPRSGWPGTPAWSLPRLGVRASPRLSSDFSSRASSCRPRSPSETRRSCPPSTMLSTLGIDPAARIGVTRWDFATDVEEEPEKWRLHVATLEAHEPFRGFVYRTAGADGSVVYIATSGKPVFDAHGRFLGYRGVSSDVTGAVRAEQVERALHLAQAELARVTRVTTLGELAASIAHEINQPLAAIGADANACLHWLAADRPDLDSVREALTAIVKDGLRAGEVITRIRALLTRSSVARGPCDLTGVIRDVLPLVGPEIRRHGISLEMSLAPNLPQVAGDRIQLQQVLLNLLMNAAEAMREVPPVRRRMVVRATADHRDDGPWAIVAVEDAGVGFSEAEAPRLFEAFYTTKPGGLGMGLSISRSIIDGHRGRLWATANPGHGATFQFALPPMP